jgi:glycosyltransferase involved in cell wall biosynthesis
MKVLYISGSFPPMKCGVGDYALKLILNIKNIEPKLEIGMITSLDGSCKDISETNFTIFNQIVSWNFSEIKEIKKIIRLWSPDLVHLQYPTAGYAYQLMPNFLPLLLANSNTKILQTWHDPFSSKGIFRYLPNLLTRDTVVVVEENFTNYLPKWYIPLLHFKEFKYIPVASNIPSISLTSKRIQEIRYKYNCINRKLITFFGFASEKKGIDQIFDIADPSEHNIILICELMENEPYHKIVLSRLNSPEWLGKVSIAGYLPENEVAELLASSDAVIFPFIGGVSSRNASVLAAQSQGTFVITTSTQEVGYSEEKNTYYANPNDISEMRSALKHYVARKNIQNQSCQWNKIAQDHIKLYKSLTETDSM